MPWGSRRDLHVACMAIDCVLTSLDMKWRLDWLHVSDMLSVSYSWFESVILSSCLPDSETYVNWMTVVVQKDKSVWWWRSDLRMLFHAVYASAIHSLVNKWFIVKIVILINSDWWMILEQQQQQQGKPVSVEVCCAVVFYAAFERGIVCHLRSFIMVSFQRTCLFFWLVFCRVGRRHTCRVNRTSDTSLYLFAKKYQRYLALVIQINYSSFIYTRNQWLEDLWADSI